VTLRERRDEQADDWARFARTPGTTTAVVAAGSRGDDGKFVLDDYFEGPGQDLGKRPGRDPDDVLRPADPALPLRWRARDGGTAHRADRRGPVESDPRLPLFLHLRAVNP
jgi:hypothetical protein